MRRDHNASQSPADCHQSPDNSAAVSNAANYFEPFQRIPIPVHSMGPDGLLKEVNEAWIGYTGYTRSRAVGHSFAEFLDPASALRYRDRSVPELVATVATFESRSVEYRLVKASGEFADIVLTARPERDPVTGAFIHSLSVINDITARNRAEAALRQKQKLEALGNLTSGVAHDFNNLLMIVLGSLQLLARRLPNDDLRANRLVAAALQGARRGAALTSRLLAFARQQELVPVPINPDQLFSSMRPMLMPLLGPDIRVEVEPYTGPGNLLADRNQLELALLNLAANARDAMPSGGTFRLSARNATITNGEVGLADASGHLDAPPGDHVVVTVRDDGTGMDEAALARAADPFFTTKGPGKGTGLGLSMVHGFAVQSGGALVLSSAKGTGTTVELWLPRTLDAAVEPDGKPESIPPESHGSEGRSLRILLVDDDPLVVAGTIGMLEELGHEAVHAVGSGEEALEILRNGGDFDLVLTDHVMPGMSGVKLADQARSLHPKLPVLLASGFAELDALAGISCPRLRKPYSLADLSAALANLKL